MSDANWLLGNGRAAKVCRTNPRGAGRAGCSGVGKGTVAVSATSTQRTPKSLVGHRNAYSVRLPVFEGPLDLLLHLIRTQKLDITEVAISSVTQQYLDYLALMETLDLEIASEFIVMAATLMEIKSRSLLPRPDPPVEEEEGADPRAELVQRLLEYERFQQVAEQLQQLAAESQRTFTRSVVEQWEGAVPLVELRPTDLLDALRRLHSDPEEAAEAGLPAALRVRRQAVTLKQRISDVLRRVRAQHGLLAFSSLVTRSGVRASRREVLVTFLAVLELVRQQQISAWQDVVCGEIYLSNREDASSSTSPSDSERDGGTLDEGGSGSGSPGSDITSL